MQIKEWRVYRGDERSPDAVAVLKEIVALLQARGFALDHDDSGPVICRRDQFTTQVGWATQVDTQLLDAVEDRIELVEVPDIWCPVCNEAHKGACGVKVGG